MEKTVDQPVNDSEKDIKVKSDMDPVSKVKLKKVELDFIVVFIWFGALKVLLTKYHCIISQFSSLWTRW